MALAPYTQAQIDAMRRDGIKHNAANAEAALSAWQAANPIAPAPVTPAPTPTPVPAPSAPATPAPTALSAYDTFKNSINYTGRLHEGQRALDAKYSALGMFQSGAADIAAIEYGQNFASQELGNYMNLLAGQQATGLSAAGAVMGVSTNATNNIAAGNTAAGNAAANAALVAGQGKANTYGAIASGVGQLGGALYQYGMGGGGF